MLMLAVGALLQPLRHPTTRATSPTGALMCAASANRILVCSNKACRKGGSHDTLRLVAAPLLPVE